jgi:hypothetical protein
MEVPKTWSETYDMIALLKKRYMDFAPPDYHTILYQQGGTLYKNNGSQINLDSEVAIQSFITVTDYYITYNCPKSYNFQNRFRFGEMPVGAILESGYPLARAYGRMDDGDLRRRVVGNRIAQRLLAVRRRG